MTAHTHWIQTLNEGVYNYDDPALSTPITSATIAHSLARLPRFTGHTRIKWTVADHSLLVREIGMQLLTNAADRIKAAPYLLLHDAHEAFLGGDIPYPLKQYIRDRFGFDFEKLAVETDLRIYRTFGLNERYVGWIAEVVRESDLYALKLERDHLMKSKHEWPVDEVVLPSNITPSFGREVPTNSLSRILRLQIEEDVRESKARV